MAERSGINLLPEEGREEEHQRERRRLLTLTSLGIIVTVAVLTSASFLVGAYLGNLNESYKGRIAVARESLGDLKTLEVSYRTVNNKLIRLQGILATYPRHSLLLDDIASFTPTGVSLTSFTFDSTNKLSISGIAAGPGNFGDFVNILRDPKLGGAKFTGVEIVAVSGGGRQGDYRFTLAMTKKAGT